MPAEATVTFRLRSVITSILVQAVPVVVVDVLLLSVSVGLDRKKFHGGGMDAGKDP